MKTPPSRKWSARIDLMPVNPPTLRVFGQVETSASNNLPKLTEAVPQGINEKMLILDLDIVNTGGNGTQAFGYRDTSFDKRVERGQYTHVEIRFHGSLVVLLEVTETH